MGRHIDAALYVTVGHTTHITWQTWEAKSQALCCDALRDRHHTTAYVSAGPWITRTCTVMQMPAIMPPTGMATGSVAKTIGRDSRHMTNFLNIR